LGGVGRSLYSKRLPYDIIVMRHDSPYLKGRPSWPSRLNCPAPAALLIPSLWPWVAQVH
jgi:hypothetical protein